MTREQKKSIEQTMKLLHEVSKSYKEFGSNFRVRETLQGMKTQFPIQAKRIFSK